MTCDFFKEERNNWMFFYLKGFNGKKKGKFLTEHSS